MPAVCRATSWQWWKVRHPAFRAGTNSALDPTHHLYVSETISANHYFVEPVVVDALMA
jgi:hypothetical protein